MRLAWAFFSRDAAIALSYRFSFAAQLFGNFLLVGLLYFVSKTAGLDHVPALKAYGGSFMAFVLIGVALTDCVLVSLVSFAQQVRESQTTGTLEATLISPVPLPLILIYSTLWSYFLSAIRFVLYLIAGAALGSLNMSTINVPASIVIFFLTVCSFLGLGILWAGIVLLIKRGEALMGLLSIVVMLLSGMLFPITVLPGWLQFLAGLVPLTTALEAMRMAVLRGTDLSQLGTLLLKLSAFAVVLLAAGFWGFHWAVKLGRRNGSLTEY
ncbi:MAG TPA: ABC transporter permease [Paludibaculum sp.]|jgi:ABC-2 type transport system permease protein